MTTAGRSSDNVLPFMHLPKGRRLSREEVTKDELSHGCEQAHEQGSTGEGLELPSVLSSDAIALSDRLDGDIVLYFFFLFLFLFIYRVALYSSTFVYEHTTTSPAFHIEVSWLSFLHSYSAILDLQQSSDSIRSIHHFILYSSRIAAVHALGHQHQYHRLHQHHGPAQGSRLVYRYYHP